LTLSAKAFVFAEALWAIHRDELKPRVRNSPFPSLQKEEEED
jgi:hypothetical protein